MLLMLTIQAKAQTVIDSVLGLIHDQAGMYSPGTRIQGPVKSIETYRQYAYSGDAIIHMIREHLYKQFDKRKSRNDRSSAATGKYLPEEKAWYNQRQQLTRAAVYYDNAKIISSNLYYDSLHRLAYTTGNLYGNLYLYQDGRPVFRSGLEDYTLYQYEQHDDTTTAYWYDDDRTAWFKCTYLSSGKIITLLSKAVSDIEYYEEYIFRYEADKIIIDNYTYQISEQDRIAEDEKDRAFVVTYPDTVRKAVPVPLSRRERVLRQQIIFETKDGITTRSSFDCWMREHPRRESYTRYNAQGDVLEETISVTGGTALYRYTYTYDQHGNWIKKETSIDEENDEVKFSPVLRTITYYQPNEKQAVQPFPPSYRARLSKAQKQYQARLATVQ